ncbi:MAG TPA: penicillin-binding protein [Vicinamibacterales bacterium]|nr:penicillin-binding protein [Vicinamibacterales bacterium]
MADEQARTGFRLPWQRSGRSRARRGEPRPAPDWRQTIRSRLTVAAALLGLWTASIEARLIYLQVFEHAEMVMRADKQRLNTLEPPARRGDILDRNGNLLAYSVDAGSVFADPSQIEDPDSVALKVCRALDSCDKDDRAAIVKNLRRNGQFAYLARKVTPAEEQRVRALNIKGIGIVKESRRFYPKRELLSHVLGYVGMDNAGLAGVESSFDPQIRGRAGRVQVQLDAKRNAMMSYVEREATAGATLELTIDQYLQNIAERELEWGVREYRAAGGSIVVMDPNTGEILAMANAPDFNPNSYARASDLQRRNRAIQDLYEPGSTFKIVTAGAALEEGLINPDDKIDVSAGMIRFGSRRIDDVHRYGVLSFTDIIVKSSNVGAIKVGLKLGPERLSRYVSRFGFGQQVVPDFRGENPGIVWSATKLDSSAVASVAMGYQVGVTPVQMATAVSSVANGGTLYEPRVVRATIKDGQRIEVGHKALRRTVSEHTAARLTAIMEAVVERGTATKAQIAGYTIAGKTGTAHKVVDGGYSSTDYNASFVGFVPSRKPALTIVVLIDSPHGNGYMGGAVAAPVFKRVAEASLRHLGIAPTVNAPPPVLVAGRTAESEAVVTPISLRSARTKAIPAPDGYMPDLRGLSAREALRTITNIGLTPKFKGSGFVLDQQPAPGSVLIPGDACTVTLGRQLAPPAPSGPPQ